MYQFTPAEIAFMHDRNENFHGTQANFEKLRKYQAIKKDLLELMSTCRNIQVVDCFDLNVREKNALLWLDLFPAASFDREETAALTAVMAKADGTVISSIGDRVRISFEILNIWEN